MVRQGNISDISKIISILSYSFSEEDLQSSYLYYSQKIRDTFSFLVLIDDTNSMCLLVERVGNFKCQFHVYSTDDSRGSNILLFAKECAQWLFKNTEYTSYLTFVCSRHAALFTRKIGMKPLGVVKDAGGSEVDEELYTGTKENIMKKMKIKGDM